MKLRPQKFLVYFTLFLFINTITFGQQQEDEKSSYLIQRGDIITIRVMDHNEFTVNNVIVLPDGFIQYPGIGSIKVIDYTPAQLKQIIKEHLVNFIPYPVVTIHVNRLYKQDINVLGYVNKPGRYQIFEPIDILTAFSLAGGIIELKNANKIKIIRFNGNMFTIKIDRIWETENKNSSSMIKKRKSILIYPGDTVFVIEPKEFNWRALLIVVSTLNLLLNAYRITK